MTRSAASPVRVASTDPAGKHICSPRASTTPWTTRHRRCCSRAATALAGAPASLATKTSGPGSRSVMALSASPCRVRGIAACGQHRRPSPPWVLGAYRPGQRLKLADRASEIAALQYTDQGTLMTAHLRIPDLGRPVVPVPDLLHQADTRRALVGHHQGGAHRPIRACWRRDRPAQEIQPQQGVESQPAVGAQGRAGGRA